MSSSVAPGTTGRLGRRGAEIERRDRGGGHGSSLRDLRPRRPVVPGATLEDIAVRNGRTGGGHMRILVAVASRHGSTREIGEAVAEVLRDSGFGVDVADPDDVESIDPYQAVMLGSSVYVGRWAASRRGRRRTATPDAASDRRHTGPPAPARTPPSCRPASHPPTAHARHHRGAIM